MSATSADPEVIVGRYLDEVLTLDRSTLTEVPVVPTTATAMPVDRLRMALTDPSTLTRTCQGARDTVDVLLMFALWLEKAGAAHVPDELASRAARYRFLVWSLPARSGWSAPREMYSELVRWPDGEEEQVIDEDRIFTEARAAQQEWKRHLDAWEDDPWLAARHLDADDRIEDDLRWLTTTWPRTRRADGQPDWPAQPAILDLGSAPDQRRVAADTVERHWLARGSLLRSAEALAPGSRWRWLLALYPLAAAVVVLLLLGGHADVARWSAVILLGAGLTATILAPPRLDSVALLRVPAAAAVGLAVLVSFTARWWTALHGWWIGAALLAAAWAYVVLEARFHGARRGRALGRGLLITTLGTLHAAVLSIAVLGFVAPAMADHGECLDGWWRTADAWHALPISTRPPAHAPSGTASCAATLRTAHAGAPAGILLLMTGWSFAIGLTGQILWDDRPLTAPLGRLRRVRGGT